MSGIHCGCDARRRGFSLPELLLVVMLLGVAAAVVVPRLAGASEDARSSAAEDAVSELRAGLLSHWARSGALGGGSFPSLNDLVTPGLVLPGAVPANPYTGSRTVQAVTEQQAESRAVFGEAGWNYYVDNSRSVPEAVIYLNAAARTTVPDGRGGMRAANEL